MPEPATSSATAQCRHRAAELASLGYYPPQHSGTPQPGGMPIHALLDSVLLPEKDIVPTATRWRDDKLIVICAILALLGWIAVLVISLVVTLAR